ncbi:TPA: hypothetical protein ACU9K7_003619 [Salmonella enterica]
MQFTKEQLTERARRKVKELEFAITQSAFTSIRDGLNEELELARIALASLTAEPVLYAAEETLAYANMGEIHLTCLSEPMGDAVIPLYTVPPVQETGIYKDMLNIISLLEKNEWAEHCTSTVLGSLLESEITRLVSKEQPAPVVPDERAAFNAWNNENNLPIAGVGAKNAAWLAWQARASLCGNSALNVPPERPADSSNGDDVEAWFDEGWNACRAAMLNGGKS